VAAAGGAFYQYAFSRAELLGTLERHGFVPVAARPYDPARVLRGLVPRRVGACRGPRRGPVVAPNAVAVADARSGPAPSAPRTGARAALERLARRALYTEPALRLLGHMLLVVARRP
jgi:hypothetical protein